MFRSSNFTLVLLMLRLLVLFPGGVAALLASALVVVLVFAVMVSVFEWYLCVHALVRGWMADGWMGVLNSQVVTGGLCPGRPRCRWHRRRQRWVEGQCLKFSAKV